MLDLCACRVIYPVKCIEGCIGCLEGWFSLGQVLLSLLLLLCHFSLDRCHLTEENKTIQKKKRQQQIFFERPELRHQGAVCSYLLLLCICHSPLLVQFVRLLSYFGDESLDVAVPLPQLHFLHRQLGLQVLHLRNSACAR